MKRITIKTLILLVVSFTILPIHAQEIIVVDQGLGTLENAIATHGGDVIYQLNAGEWYGLEGIIEVSDASLGGPGKTLTIVGEETESMPPVIQVGVASDGSTHPYLFSASSNLTLRNVFLADQDFTGIAGRGVIEFVSSVRVIVDNCVIDPAGQNRTFGGGDEADGSKLYLNNNLILNNGHMQGPNDGGYLGTMAWDTLWVENNTFVSSGQDFISTRFHNVPNNQFIWINHNTFFWHDLWIKKSYNDQNFYFTNNLMHDISLFAQLYSWGQFFPDYRQGNTMLSQTCIDTLMDEQGNAEKLPSQRTVFWEYNLQNSSPQLRSLPKKAVDEGYKPLYIIPMLWNEDVPLDYTGGIEVVSPADSSRENRIFADDANWPLMKYDHNWYDKDPMYSNPQIYNTNDSMILNLMDWYGEIIWKDGSNFDGTPSYMWSMDKWAGTDPTEYPQVWPRFDGSYTNPELLSASIEGLPLGDLNWFPAQRSLWFSEREQIETHILSLNEQRYPLGADPDTLLYGVKIRVKDQSSEAIEGAALIIEGDTLAWSNQGGLIQFDTLIGIYPFTLMANGFKDSTGEFEVSYSGYSGEVMMEIIEYELKFVVIDSTYDPVDSLENASIEIDGKPDVFYTNSEGWVVFDTIGRIDFMVNKSGYLPGYGNVTITQPEVLTIGLDPLRPIHFEISGYKGEPMYGAMVQIDQRALYTDLDGSVSTELSDGEYPYVVSASNHLLFKDTLEVNGTVADSTIKIELVPVSYTVTFVVSDGLDPVDQAIVEIDDETLTSNANGVASVNMVNGAYDYIAFAVDTDTTKGTVEVDGDAVVKNVVLTKISSVETLAQDGIQIYPNPANDYFVIKIGEMTNASVQLINAIGAVCLESRLSSPTSTIQLDGLEEGVYIVLIKNSEKHYTGKITLRR